jgi:hypothetical protein
MKILFSEFHRRTNLTIVPLLSKLGFKNKTTNQNFEILNLKVSYKFRILNAILNSLVMKILLKLKISKLKFNDQSQFRNFLQILEENTLM